jgi:hypothetical protein
MLKTNADRLVMQSVQGTVSPGGGGVVNINWDRMNIVTPGTGNITYGLEIGDCCMGLMADHVEPGVTTKIIDNDQFNAGYNILSSIGNTVKVVTGDAKGATGYVTGKHGGCEHLMVHFDRETKEKMTMDDKILIKAYGQGLLLEDHPNIIVRNLDPNLLDKFNIIEEGKKIKIGVAKIVPACIMGSGLGTVSPNAGDYDITLHDKKIMKKYGLDELRFGDIVAIMDADTRYGRNYRTGAVTIGVIVHGDCKQAGHGPGVTSLLSCKTSDIVPFIDENANLAHYFDVK